MKLIPRYKHGNKTKEYEPDWSDKYEPTASLIGLNSDLTALGLASTGWGAPLAPVVAGLGNFPNLVIDGYQTGRDWYRHFKDDAPIEDALWNTGELFLDFIGAKYATKGAKAANKATRENKVEKEVNKLVKKNGKTNSKEVTTKVYPKIDKKEAVNILLAKLIANAPANIYHGKDLFIAPLDNTRNVKKVNLNE